MPKARKNQKSPMIFTILGCGTSVGAPMIGFQHLKQFKNPKNHRMRASLLIEPFGRGGPAVVVDTSPDFREQVLRFFPKKNPRLDGIIITHTHADHLHGLDDIRPFNFIQKQEIPLYGEPYVLDEIRLKFSYIFQPTQEGGGKPKLTLHPITDEKFTLSHCADERLHKFTAEPLPLRHGGIPNMGFRFGPLAYITDCTEIPESTLGKLKNLDVLILDCLRYRSSPTHLTVEMAIDYAKRIKAKKTVFTHMGFELEYEVFRKSLPRGMVPAYDGMQFRF
jgi:phosphoribosyl 1,2-cyclic phosphate phosphodiesterase